MAQGGESEQEVARRATA